MNVSIQHTNSFRCVMPFRLHAHALTLYDNMAATVLHTYSVLNVTL